MGGVSANKASRARGPYAKSAKRAIDILDAATKVFATHGYRGGSLRDIARQLDLSLTSITHHFGTKDALLVAVLERADETGQFEVDCAERGVAFATMERVKGNLEKPELLRLLAILAAESSSPEHPAHEWFVERYRRKIQFLGDAFAYDQSRGRIDRDRDPQLLARLLIGIWDGIQLQWLIDPTHDMESAMLAFLEWTLPDGVVPEAD